MRVFNRFEMYTGRTCNRNPAKERSYPNLLCGAKSTDDVGRKRSLHPPAALFSFRHELRWYERQKVRRRPPREITDWAMSRFLLAKEIHLNRRTGCLNFLNTASRLVAPIFSCPYVPRGRFHSEILPCKKFIAPTEVCERTTD